MHKERPICLGTASAIGGACSPGRPAKSRRLSGMANLRSLIHFTYRHKIVPMRPFDPTWSTSPNKTLTSAQLGPPSPQLGPYLNQHMLAAGPDLNLHAHSTASI